MKDKNKAQINARAETVLSKPMFKHSALNRRCLVLASGWYEWHAMPHGKQPYRIYLKDNCMFAFAGIWTTWHAEGEESKDVDSYAIITTEANSVTARIHPRMPVVLGSKTCEYWLAANEKETRLKAMLRPYDGKDLFGYPVSNYVSSPKNTDAKCIEPLRS